MNVDERHEIIKQCAVRLREHFDSVQIVCTRWEDDDVGTYAHQHGRGNLYARIGSVREWLLKEEQHMRCQATDEHNREDT